MACPDVSRFDCCSNQDFFERIEEVNKARQDWENRSVTKAAYELKEKTMGMQSNAFGLLAAQDLRGFVRPADIITHDVQHICFCSGVVGVELHLFLRTIRDKIGMQGHHIKGFLQAAWSFPDHRHCLLYTSPSPRDS